MPPALAGVKPTNTGGFEDIEKIKEEGKPSALNLTISAEETAQPKPSHARNCYKALSAPRCYAQHHPQSGAIWALKLENIDLEERIIRIQGVPESTESKALKYPLKSINDDSRYLKEILLQNPQEVWYLTMAKGQWRKVLNLTGSEGHCLKNSTCKMKPFQ